MPKRRTPLPQRRSARNTRRSFVFTPLATTLVLMVCAVLWATLTYYGTRAALFQVDTVQVQGGTTISPMAVRSVAEEVLEGSYFGLVPYRFTYRVPYAEIEERLRDMPRLANVRITQPERNILSIEFEEHQPHALWCDTETCMFINQEGYAFADAPASLTGSLYPRVVVASTSPKYGNYVPADIPLREMFALRVSFAAYKLSLVETQYIDEHDVWYHFTDGGIIKTRRSDSADLIQKRLEQLFSTKEYAVLPKDGFKSIDLRFGNRVYVKDKNAKDEEVAAAATSVAAEVVPVATTTTQTHETVETQ